MHPRRHDCRQLGLHGLLYTAKDARDRAPHRLVVACLGDGSDFADSGTRLSQVFGFERMAGDFRDALGVAVGSQRGVSLLVAKADRFEGHMAVFEKVVSGGLLAERGRPVGGCQCRREMKTCECATIAGDFCRWVCGACDESPVRVDVIGFSRGGMLPAALARSAICAFEKEIDVCDAPLAVNLHFVDCGLFWPDTTFFPLPEATGTDRARLATLQARHGKTAIAASSQMVVSVAGVAGSAFQWSNPDRDFVVQEAEAVCQWVCSRVVENESDDPPRSADAPVLSKRWLGVGQDVDLQLHMGCLVEYAGIVGGQIVSDLDQ